MIIVLAVALGFSGKLCWDKFSPVVARHFETLASQEKIDEQLAWPASGSDYSLSSNPRPITKAVLQLLGSPTRTMIVFTEVAWAGRMQSAEGRPRLVVILRSRIPSPTATIGPSDGSSPDAPARSQLSPFLGYVLRPATLFRRSLILKKSPLSVQTPGLIVSSSEWNAATPAQVKLNCVVGSASVSYRVTLGTDDELSIEALR